MALNTNYADRLPSRVGIPVVEVFSLDNLPTPAANVITLADNTLYQFLNDVDLGANQLVTGDNTTVGAISNIIVLSGTTTVPLIVNNGTNGTTLRRITVSQLGSGDLMSITSTAGTEITALIACVLSGGDVRCISGLVLVNERCIYGFGSRVVQDSSGGMDILNFDTTALFDSGAIDGLILLETGSSTESLVFLNSAMIMITSGSVGLRIEAGATVTNLDMDTIRFSPIVAGTTAIIVENPDAISIGSIRDSDVTGAGTLLTCQPVSSSNFASPDADPRDVGFDGTNLLSCDPSTAVNASVYLHTGVTSAITTTLTNAVFTGVRSVAWNRGNLISITDDGGAGTIRIHDGFSVVVDDSFASPAANPVGIVSTGANLISLDNTVGVVSVHDGETSTILFTFVSPAGVNSSGICYDGINVVISDSTNNLIYVMEGISATVQYSFAGPGTVASGVTIVRSGAVVSDSTATAAMYVFDHPITFDHSSATWEMMNNLGVIESSDRGGASFETVDPLTGIQMSAFVQDVWRDIEDGGTDIFYGIFQSMEKCDLNNEQNGEMIWTGVRQRGRVLSCFAMYSRNGGGPDVTFELAVVINGIGQRDSVTRGLIAAAADFITHPTIPITRDLKEGDVIKIQIRNLAGTEAPQIVQSKIAIN